MPLGIAFLGGQRADWFFSVTGIITGWRKLCRLFRDFALIVLPEVHVTLHNGASYNTNNTTCQVAQRTDSNHSMTHSQTYNCIWYLERYLSQLYFRFLFLWLQELQDRYHKFSRVSLILCSRIGSETIVSKTRQRTFSELFRILGYHCRSIIN